MSNDTTENMVLDPESFGGEDFPEWRSVVNPDWDDRKERVVLATPKSMNSPLITPEEQAAVDAFYKTNPHLKQEVYSHRPQPVFDSHRQSVFEVGSFKYNDEEPWIQTYSGRRFTPTNPYVDAIVIQDIAHALSMKCRFNGHPKKFYSVAQHCVLVSYICDSGDALWGLMHDASEAYLVDFPAPLKHSGKFDDYIAVEDNMQRAICKRFGLPEVEPVSVKKADKMLLATEARDLMGPLHPDWRQPAEPLPFKIDALPQQEAKNLFMKRFFELTGAPESAYAHYLSTQT
jgi:5'-deoxynucleotidase YfbR-like HD superfamily hydrolase